MSFNDFIELQSKCFLIEGELQTRSAATRIETLSVPVPFAIPRKLLKSNAGAARGKEGQCSPST
jgi:hypothetical protein